MATRTTATSIEDVALQTTQRPLMSGLSRFEQIIANNPPVLDSLVAQLPTQSIFDLYHTSSFLNQFFRNSPTSWRYMSWRLHQPSTNANPNNLILPNQRQAGPYALDQLLFNLVIPFSTRLTSLVLDNTSVSGATLFSAVMILRKDTLEHVSVRGCKNVSLKYHINPWLAMHAMATRQADHLRPPEFQKLALKYLYTYRCRHHRRRPYLPASLNRKESDSEPTHELVLTCHKLGIWTDTAWCTTPGARCYRRRGYVNMRAQQDPREVWVVFDRLWRSKNWLGDAPGKDVKQSKKRKHDGRFWEEEDGIHGEPIGLSAEDKQVPAHLRESHTKFVDNVQCDECAAPITERCEQCSVTMHCLGCRKTLCASCAFDRPYTRNSDRPEEARKNFWWAPGAAISPCCMQDTDPNPNAVPNQPVPLPNITFKWCCTEPVFSGGGGITLAGSQAQDADRLRAAPLPPGQGFEDAEFATHHIEECNEMGSPLSRASATGPGGRWASLEDMFKYGAQMHMQEEVESIPRILCNDCYSSDQWKLKCKSCSVALCLKHDVKEKQRVRICGYKDLNVEKQELIARLRATKLFKSLWMKKKALESRTVSESAAHLRSQAERIMDEAQLAFATNLLLDEGVSDHEQLIKVNSPHLFPLDQATMPSLPLRTLERPTTVETDITRPLSPGSNSTGPLSREVSPAPSTRSLGAVSQSNGADQKNKEILIDPVTWKGCQSFFCPSIRPTGDNRRRCSAIMRQCRDCKVYVCDDCVSDLDKPCPCQGCRLPVGESDPITGSTSSFYCPNCRHERIVKRECRKSLSCLGKGKMPMLQKEKRNKHKMTPQEKIGHIANILLDTSPNISTTEEFTLENFYDSVNQELLELQEISLSAISVCQKVQTLRSQAPPGSPAALALPRIMIEGIDELQASSSGT